MDVSRSAKAIWFDQFEAAGEIKTRYGSRAAFDYIVAEKLMNFAEAARTMPDFAREMPAFVAAVRGLFAHEEMLVHLSRIERELTVMPDEDPEDDEALREDPAALAVRQCSFASLKELLSASRLGTA